MRFKKLDLNLLVALDHMLALQSVSAAAEKMFMSQSAMSNALTRLRTYFDDPLLVQVGKRMELTPRAEAMQPAIRDILVRVEATIDTQPEFDPTISTRAFNILVSDYTLRVLMPIVVAEMDRQGARVKLNLLSQRETPFLMLERGDADLLVTPDHFISPNHPSTLLYEDRYVVLACAKGPYADVEMDIDLYQAAPHAIMIPPSAGAKPAESLVLNNLGITRNVELTTFSFSALPHLLAGTGRIATVHAHLAKVAMKTTPLVHYELPFELETFKQNMQWHSYRDHDPGILWLRDVFLKSAQILSERD
ncbi:LysR family transcriptional regulator [Tropicibacter sp. R15_0]|uniref:LysR family transcriptional regulator n=1 Tax=Tropicibacter sp. R15_0 TaxID=2821101 RepID=UPI001ADD59BE|nr:LysR family transcriptional regulator [Tropicibacter sp. R15_0]MBO9465824.1 LysR family transcriptional regulator [Tropicibacter sp. R15_0]